MGIDSTLTLKKRRHIWKCDGLQVKRQLQKPLARANTQSKNGVITTVDEYKEKSFYKIEGESLKMLDMDQKEVTGELKDKYILNA